MQVGTQAQVADNSGATRVRCIQVLRGRPRARLGQEVVVAVCAVSRNAKVKRGTVHRALVVRQARLTPRRDGSAWCAPGVGGQASRPKTWVVLLTSQGQPLGTRMVGALGWELRAAGHRKLLSLASSLL
uniref:Ribosomal protein L14 n=1 Tax=Picocystis salinarum TaxID=88271 RepID=A0A4D6C6M8_9CHLO|nr:ribosomal protein L14 [Picocystis salinarum]QBX98533.1 ribosomal protein L14 [Picocystis salinarum]